MLIDGLCIISKCGFYNGWGSWERIPKTEKFW